MGQRPAQEWAGVEVVTITAHGSEYRIYNPGEGRIGSKLNMGTVYEAMMLEEVYDRGLSGAVFDVGAHIGNHTLWFSGICGLRTYAFEPYLDSLLQLWDNLKLNPQLEVEVFDWAAGAEHGMGRFTDRMWIEFDPSRTGDKLKLNRGEVAVHPIDEMLDVEDLVLVKVDVEGMEPDVLKGLVRHLARSKPLVYAETHTKTAQQRTAEVMEPLGYRVTGVLKMGSPQVRWEC